MFRPRHIALTGLKRVPSEVSNVEKSEAEERNAEDRTTKRIRASRWGYVNTDVKNDDNIVMDHQSTSDVKQEDLNFSVVSPSLPVDKRPQEDDYDDYDMPLVAIKRVPSKLGGSIKISISKSSLGDVSTEDSKSTVIGSGVGLDTPPSSTNYEAGGCSLLTFDIHRFFFF